MMMLFVLIAGLSFIGLVNAYLPECLLGVPYNALTAEGLATPYLLTNSDNLPGYCDQSDSSYSTFVQGAILDTDTGDIYIYNPLVISGLDSANPAISPTVPILPQNSVVALWFGTNADYMQLESSDALSANNCSSEYRDNVVGGQPGEQIVNPFTKFASCNAATFFAAVNDSIQSGKLTVPPLGTALDGKPCPTVRDFAFVDSDQSGGVLTSYLMTRNPNNPSQRLFAQDTPTNRNTLGTNFDVLTNIDDNRLVAVYIDDALGCNPWKVRDLAETNQTSLVNGLPLNEIQAQFMQAQPQALVSQNDQQTDLITLPAGNQAGVINLYRSAVFQPLVTNPDVEANQTEYCQNFAAAAGSRLDLNLDRFRAVVSPDNTTTLYDFLVQRFNNSFAALNCFALGVFDPFTTAAPTTSPTTAPTMSPTVAPTMSPTKAPTSALATAGTTKIALKDPGIWIFVSVILIVFFAFFYARLTEGKWPGCSK
jgi:hypothetical protein